MKKSNFICGIIFLAAGMVFLMAARLDTPFQDLFWSFAGAGIAPGVVMMAKYVYWSHPNHQAKYSEKLETETIEMHDERKEMLRGKTARYLYAYRLLAIGISIVIFDILDKLIVIEGTRIFIIYFVLLFLSEVILSHIIMKWLEKRY